ncbi:MAG: TonB-dependent receptor [Syntrophales bacterium]|nr:TonB-dependent receptor [Syntrophales bacterium]
MKRSVFVFLLMILIFSTGETVSAQMEGKKTEGKETVRLEEVVVTASRIEEKKREVVANVIVIDEEEIRSSSAKDLGDLLAEKGVGTIMKYDSSTTSIGIRAFRTDATGIDLASRVLILIDGRRSGTANAAKVMTNNIEKVEIIRGPAAVQYGTTAVGGVVNVITKKGTGKPSFYADGFIGSYDYKGGTIGFSGTFKKMDFSGSFTRDSRGDYETAQGIKYFNTGYNHKENGSINVGYEFLPGNRIGFIYTFFKVDHQGNPGYLSQNDKDDYVQSRNHSFDVIYDGKTTTGLLSWKVRYFAGRDKNEWFDPTGSNPDGWDDGVPDRNVVDFKGAQIQVSYNRTLFTVTGGGDWIQYKTESTSSPKNTGYDNPAAFLLGKLKLFNDSFIISGGARYDEYRVDVKSEGGKESEHHISPQVGLAYIPTKWLKLRANYGQAFRMPSAEQLAGNYWSWGTHFVGNPDLKPEKSRTYEGGIDISISALNASLSYFHTDFRDKIEWYTKPNGDRSARNIGKAEIEGVEGSLSYDLGNLFSWPIRVLPYITGTYMMKYRDKDTNEDLKYTSDLLVTYGITIYGEDFSANLNFSYVGKQLIDDWESGAYPTPVITKGSFTVANLAITKKLLTLNKYGYLTLRGEIQNLFDKDYEYVKGYPMPGRTFTLGLRYTF